MADDVAKLLASDFHNTFAPALTVGVVIVTLLLLLLTVVQVLPPFNEYETLGTYVAVTTAGIFNENVVAD